MEPKKKVACFYRVSTKKQLDENDIPMQKTACREFIKEHPNWVLVEEYIEKGVSGFKTGSEDRDEIQRALYDAKNKRYDILLCFMKDRLGRREDDTPFIVENLVRMGVEVWSVKEGQQKIENRIDKLMNYLYFWNAGSESEKTSIRVDEKHKQMVEKGLYRGGSAPYGYKLVPSGVFNKKGKELYKLAICEEEAKVVRLIYNLVYEYGYGVNRILNYLNNETEYKNKNGKKWISGTINYILRNPIYKGYVTYGKTKRIYNNVKSNQPREKWILSKKPNEDLIIIPEEIWNKVQQIRKSRSPYDNNEIESTKRPLKGKLLLTGIIFCGHCGTSLVAGYDYKKWTTKDGTLHKVKRFKYRCDGKKIGKNCEGQSTYSKQKIESIVLNQVYEYLDKLGKIDFKKKINEYIENNLQEEEKKLKELQKLNEKNYEELNVLNSEIVKSLQGKSHFKPEILSKLIEEKESLIKNTSDKIKDIQKELTDRKIEINDMLLLQKNIPTWKEIFNKAPLDKQKMLIRKIVDKVVVYRDKIQVYIKLQLSQFINTSNQKEINYGDDISLKWENTLNENTTHKFIEELLIAKIA